jgi:GT2 family glycosyltransferase
VNVSDLDVIVVDYFSTDASVECASNWLETYGEAFNSWIMLQHERNNGLSETINLGVSYCHSSYYFALDADNKLEPDCIEHCLRRFRQLDGKKALGAVYPARRLFGETTSIFKDTNTFADVGKWDPERLSKGNYIDAMALIRKSAWRRVGGYTVISFLGGWEDYDFWCKFVECGLHAEYEPAAVAHYRTHQSSMLHKRTHTKSAFPVLASAFHEKHPWVSLEP